jgi:thimet oligopeptidase
VSTHRVTLPILDDITLTAACAQILTDARAGMATLAALPLESVTPETLLDVWDDEAIRLENIAGPIAILNNVHPDKAVRDAADASMRELAMFTTELFQNEALFERVRAVEPRTEAQRQFRKDLIETFEDTGVALPQDRRARAKAISEALVVLNQEFSRNLRDNQTRLTFTPDECEGLPDAYLARVPRDAEGRVVLGFDYPDFNPFMANARNEEARRRYYIAYLNRGTSRNSEILDEIVALRRELASLYDLPSYAHYITRRRMAGSPQAVLDFLSGVRGAVAEVEARDVEELRQLKAEMTGTPAETVRLNRWDVSYYSERLRERRYNVDQEAFRKYFPTPQTLDWLLHVSSRVFGVRFEAAAVPVWHEDVRYYDVIDEADGTRIGGIYCDLYPRDGKFTHAAAWPVRGASTRAGRTPITVMVANFDRGGLTHNEVETFFHEFGHVLHGVLSETHYNQHAGTNVERDFVEAPSQIYEEWTRHLESLATIREVCPGCPVMDAATVDRLNAARRFGAGMQYARQHLYASFDMTLYGEQPQPALQTWQAMEDETTLGFVPGTDFPATFSHIAGGYAAGYYGYMWAEVIALDMLSAFGGNLINPEVGMRFRKEILSRGGEEPAALLVERFLGRPVNNEAFLKEITGRR